MISSKMMQEEAATGAKVLGHAHIAGENEMKYACSQDLGCVGS